MLLWVHRSIGGKHTPLFWPINQKFVTDHIGEMMKNLRSYLISREDRLAMESMSQLLGCEVIGSIRIITQAGFYTENPGKKMSILLIFAATSAYLIAQVDAGSLDGNYHIKRPDNISQYFYGI